MPSHIGKQSWMMDYCLKNNLSPKNFKHWDRAERAFDCPSREDVINESLPLEQFLVATDETLAKYMRDAIEGYFASDTQDGATFICSVDKFSNAVLAISIQKRD